MSPPTESNSIPSDDPLVRGVLEVHSPSDRWIDGIEIKLQGLQSIAIVDAGMRTGTEESIVFEKVLNLGSEAAEPLDSNLTQEAVSNSPSSSSNHPNDSITLQAMSFEQEDRSSKPTKSTVNAESDAKSKIFLSKGVHGFEFSIILPSNSAPFERSTFGTVNYTLSATALAAGRSKTNLSIEKPIYPVVNPDPDGGQLTLATGYQDPLSVIGLLAADFSSENLCLSGALEIDIRSPEPKKGVKIHLIKVSIESGVQLETKKQGLVQIPKRRKVLFMKGYVSSQLSKTSSQGDKKEGMIYDDDAQGNGHGKKEWFAKSIVRLPDNTVLSPTTLEGSKAGIRWSHELLTQIYHSTPESSELQVLSFRNRITLPSCCASQDAVKLPTYNVQTSPTSIVSNSLDSSTTAPPPLPPGSPWMNGSTVKWGTKHDYCTCGQSLASLEKAIVMRRSNAEAPIDGISQSKIDDDSEANPN